MYSILHKLISAKYYCDADVAGAKTDVLYACNKLTNDEYADLTALIAQMYPAQADVSDPAESPAPDAAR